MIAAFEYLKVVAILAAVVALAFIALRFWLPNLTGMHGAPAGPMEVVGRLCLEPRKTIYVIRAGSDYLMVAASESGVQSLIALDACRMEAALQELPTPRRSK